MIFELWALHSSMVASGFGGPWARRLKEILESNDAKYADVLKQMAEDERHLRELVERLEKIVGMERSIT